MRTLLEIAQGNLWVNEINLAHESHVSEILDDFALSRLRDRMVVTVHDEFEGRFRDIFLPKIPRRSVLLVQIVIATPPSVEFVNSPCRTTER